MCGIAGIISGKHEKIKQALNAMVLSQAHRGPDDAGVDFFPFGPLTLGLGHRRLSILDLSKTGHQPMVNPKTGDTIVFNGEIYNHKSLRKDLEAEGIRFKGHSDTEVLLHALGLWGTDCLDRLEGMYAFAFFNNKKKNLILARDPLGIKPLYWVRVGNQLVFASEVRAILASGMVATELDRDGLAGLLAYGSVQEPLTLFRNIHSFPSGSWVQIQPQEDDSYFLGPVKRYWTFPQRNKRISCREAVALTGELLDGAVRSHLMSDVPVGIFLSSGLDSTIIASRAAKYNDEIRTFTVGFTEDRDYSESGPARETARRLGVDHREIMLSADDAREQVEPWLESLDQPSLDGLNTFVISKAVRANGITVALSGQGGDELFGGYPSFMDVPRLHSFLQSTRFMPNSWKAALMALLSSRKPAYLRDKLYDICHCDGNLLSLYFHRRRNLSNRQLKLLGLNEDAVGPYFMPPESLSGFEIDKEDHVRSISLMETKFYLGNTLLHVGDISGMANGLEIRVPMLDRRLIEKVLSFPDYCRLPSGRSSKYLLRRAFQEELRDELTQQAKRGFVLPVSRWMQSALHPLCQQGIDHLKHSGILDAKGIDAIWSEFLQFPETPNWSRAWTLVVLGIYLYLNPNTL